MVDVSTDVEQTNGHLPVTTPRTRQSRGRQQPERGTRRAISLYEDTQGLIWEASDRLNMTNDATVKAALKLLLKEAERRNLRRKTDEEMIDEIVGES